MKVIYSLAHFLKSQYPGAYIAVDAINNLWFSKHDPKVWFQSNVLAIRCSDNLLIVEKVNLLIHHFPRANPISTIELDLNDPSSLSELNLIFDNI